MRYNIVYAKDAFYWPQETIRHCRTGRIKRGMILKRQFGVYYPDKTRDLVALKIMEKVCYGVEDELQSAISERTAVTRTCCSCTTTWRRRTT